jgi:lysine 6-dehydrogenase
MNEYLIIGGAGLQGESIAYDILKFDPKSRVIIADKSLNDALKVRKRLNSNRVDVAYADASNLEQMLGLMGRADIAIGSAGYKYNELLTKAAIATKTHFCDLGGNNTIVEKQFELIKEAKKAGIKIIPDCGIAPGAVSILAMYGISQIKNPSYIHESVGGLPQEPKGVLNYMEVFSITGLINEYIEPVEILHDYKLKIVDPLGGRENILIKDSKFPDGRLFLEAAYTSGGSSTLAKTFKGKIKTLDYKTLRYPEHWDQIKLLYDLGFFSEEKINDVTPRFVSEKLIKRAISYKGKDMLIAKVAVGNDKEEIELQLVDFYNDKTGHSAMQRTTGYSVAIIAEMMINGAIKGAGVMKLEECVPPEKFIDAWKEREMNLKTTYTKKRLNN